MGRGTAGEPPGDAPGGPAGEGKPGGGYPRCKWVWLCSCRNRGGEDVATFPRLKPNKLAILEEVEFGVEVGADGTEAWEVPELLPCTALS